MQYIGKILPVDGYRVQVIDSLPTDYDASLVHLYQPLIGIEAISLYKLLLTEESIQDGTNYQTHHTLMNYLTISLNKIYEARLKLEGIGLLKTYEQMEDDKTVYMYVLQAPFRPVYFFQDMMLSELLYRHIGKVKFDTLKEHYTKNDTVSGGKEVTASFKDVFQTFTPQHDTMPMPQTMTPPTIPLQQIDFESIAFMLQRKNVRPNEVLTDRNKEMMTQLIHLYDLEIYELEQAINWALTEENKLDIAQLKQACHDLFQAKHNVANVQLEKKQAPIVKQEMTKPLSKMDKLIERFETISPKELLEDLSKGNNATAHEMKLISDIMTQQGLTVPVMNVLIHYVMLQSGDKLPRSYVESIAGSWSRKGFKTAREALQYTLTEVKNPAGKQKQRKYTNYAKQQGKEEVIPDWFKERDKKETTEKETLTEAEQKEQDELLKALQRHATKNN